MTGRKTTIKRNRMRWELKEQENEDISRKKAT
jgi:hypothetical protein